MHAGHLGEVTFRGGTVTSPPPPLPPPSQVGIGDRGQAEKANLVELKDGINLEKMLPSNNEKKKPTKETPKTSKKGIKKEDIRKFFQKDNSGKKPTIKKNETAPTTNKENKKDEKVNPSGKCEFKKGICTTHRVKGEKKIITSKKWCKKKDGLAGWSTSRKVEWLCKQNPDRTPVAPSKASELHQKSSAAPDLETGSICESSQGITRNFVNRGKRSDSGESLETGLE